MTRKLLTAVVCLLVLTAGAEAKRYELIDQAPYVDVQVEQSSIDRTVLNYQIGAFDAEPVQINGETYYQISADHESQIMKAGAPDLPHVCRAIIIPDDAAMKVNVISSDYVEFVDMPVAPSKGNLLRTVNPEDVPFEFGDVYTAGESFPSNLARLHEPHIMRDWRGTVIELMPYQYDAATKTLRVYKSITIEVVTDGPGQINVLHDTKRRETLVHDFDIVYQERYLNYAQAVGKYTPVEDAGDLLIITYDDFADEMAPLAAWKNQKGIKTTLVNKSTAGSTASAIKTFISNFYDTTNLAHVLLVGDASQIPTFTSGGGGADPMYSQIVGSDYYPEITVGRFSAENGTQVTTQVDRTITYERDHPGNDWFHKGTGIASNQGPGHNGGEYDNEHMDLIRDSLLSYTYTLVDQIYDPSGTATQVSNALNNGRSFINYTGHGSTTAWSTTGFSNTNVNALVNDNMLPFIVSVACVNGNFVSYTCFAEAWLRATNGSEPTGAIGAYMSSINQSWDPPMDGQDEVTHLLIQEMNNSYGALCFNGGCQMMDLNPGSAGYSMFNTWHVFGDPSVQVRTDNPAALTVNHAGAAFFNVSEYEVEVEGVEDALCALSKEGVLYGSAYTGPDGFAIISIEQMLPIGTPVTLTVTSYNGETVIEDVMVTTDLTIIHDPLPDTKDTLNDYVVDCTVYSDTTLYTDSTFLYYNAGGGWNQVAMTYMRLGDDFTATIPAQQAGTVVDYYMTATNVAGFIDTTDVFTFRVIDYGVFVTPEYQTQMAAVDDTIWYDLTVTNDGVLPDEYLLSITDDEWATAIFNTSGSVEITQTTSLNGNETFDFKVRVIVPASYEGEYDSANVVATSVADGSYSDYAAIYSVSAGMPWPIPFSDVFPSDTFHWTKWEAAVNCEISTAGLGEPTEPYSVRLNGDPNGSDTLESEQINLKDESMVLVSYAYQQTGSGDAPEADDDLIVQYLDSNMVWQELNRHLGEDPDMTEFEEVEVYLPADAFHSGFRVRFYSQGTSGPYDDWFVDDVYVGHPSDYELVVVPYEQGQYGPAGDTTGYVFSVENRGLLADAYDLSVSGNSWTTLFYDASGTTEITSTPTVPAGDTVDFVVKVVIPSDAAPHATDQATITVTSQGDSNMSSTATTSTSSGGPAIGFPFYEPFAEADISVDHWFSSTGVDVTLEGLNPPSSPYSLHFDGNADVAVTRLIDISSADGAILSFYYQSGGTEAVPSTGDDLHFEYKNSYGEWAAIYTCAGDGSAMTEFEYVNIPLPADAIHAGFQLRILSDGDSGSDDWYVDDLRLDFAPELAVDPTVIEETINTEDSLGCPLVISNVGPGGLTYSLSVVQQIGKDNPIASVAAAGDGEPAHRDYPPDFRNRPDEKGVDYPNLGHPVSRNYGGPDDYGYVWVDSDEGQGGITAFDWIDVSGVGVDLLANDSLGDDDFIGPYTIGFNFSYYGGLYSELYIGSNGIIGFAPTEMGSRHKQPIPTAEAPNNIICLLWDDLDPTDEANLNDHLYFHADSDRCVIQFVDYPEYAADPGDVMTAELILYPDGTIKAQYLSFAPNFDNQSGGVGIENGDGTDGLNVAYDTDYLHDSLAITYIKPYEWITVDQPGGLVDPGGADTIMCMLSSGTMDTGTYAAQITINSNDPNPLMNPMTIPVSLTISDGPVWDCADIDGNGTVADVADLVYMVDYMFNDGPVPDVLAACDVDGSGELNIQDLVFLSAYMFNSGPEPHCGL